MVFGLPKMDDVKRFFTAEVTEDSVDGIKVGPRVAKAVEALSDQSLLGSLPEESERKKIQVPFDNAPLSEVTRERLRARDLAEAEYAEQLKRRQAGEV